MDNYEEMTIRELRAYCKKQGIEGYSKYVNNKAALIKYIRDYYDGEEFEEPTITKFEIAVVESTSNTLEDIVVRTDGNDYVNFVLALLVFIVIAACWLTIAAGQLTRCLVDFIYAKLVEVTSSARSIEVKDI